MKRTNFIRLAGAAALAAGMAFAQAPANPQQQPAAIPDHMNQRGQCRERFMQQLNLTPEQKEEAKGIFSRARESAKPIRQELRQNREALDAAIKANDTRRIHELSNKEAGLLARMVEIRSDARASFYSKLTPAQRAKADQLHQQMKERWEARRAHRTS